MIQTVLETEGVPVKIWTKDVEPEAIEQLKNTARLPFVFKHMTVMPDVHFGLGVTIGSVVATRGAICPAAVGVDIGCGMMAVKTTLHPDQVMDRLPELRHSIERSIPVGHNWNRSISLTAEKWEGWNRWLRDTNSKLFKKAFSQLGSLGGGNHFIELCLDSDNNVWVMLHSGSRGVSNEIASERIDKAKGIMKQMFIALPDPNLAYFAQGTDEFARYIADVKWCQDYAFHNREEMMRRVLRDLSYTVNAKEPVGVAMAVNCHHNYLEWEHHYGENVIVTCKGAIRARTGDLGIIPGSTGTKSYIVRGKGNPESFDSCSHGAGRRMSRTAARNRFTVQDLADQTAGVECRKDVGVVDEIPGAYKRIEDVMADQSDLVEIVAELKQVLCVKG